MLDMDLTTAFNTTLTFWSAILTVIVSFSLGISISVTYMKTHHKGYYSQNFSLTLILIPSVIAVIILLVGSNVARAFSLQEHFLSPDSEVLQETPKTLLMSSFQWLPDLPAV